MKARESSRALLVRRLTMFVLLSILTAGAIFYGVAFVSIAKDVTP